MGDVFGKSVGALRAPAAGRRPPKPSPNGRGLGKSPAVAHRLSATEHLFNALLGVFHKYRSAVRTVKHRIVGKNLIADATVVRLGKLVSRLDGGFASGSL